MADWENTEENIYENTTDDDPKNKMEVHFSHHCGENVELSEEKHRASWIHKYSGGIAFSSQPLRNDIKLKLDLAGSGHAYVGVVICDPKTITDMRAALSRDILLAKDMKVHKRLGAVQIKSCTTEGKREITFECDGYRKDLDVTSYNNVWLFIYIKFGDLIAVLHSECTKSRCFHNITGSNIQCLDPDRRSVKLHVENPSAICCLNKRLRPGHTVTILTRAMEENGHKPSRCHLKLGVVDLDPTELKSRDPESFLIDSKVALPTRWTIVQKLLKENCEGELKLYFTSTGALYFNHSSGVEGTHQCQLKDVTSGITVILDLFRTEVKVTESHDEGIYESVDKNYDYVLPEGELIENVKRRLRISDKKKEKERPPSDGGYLEMINLPTNSGKNDLLNPNGKISPRQSRCGVYKRNNSPTNIQMCK